MCQNFTVGVVSFRCINIQYNMSIIFTRSTFGDNHNKTDAFMIYISIT
jgi:hypothetical protein